MRHAVVAEHDHAVLSEAAMALRDTSLRLEELTARSELREVHARLTALADLLAAHADRLDRLRAVSPAEP